jgi:hypothetical protein
VGQGLTESPVNDTSPKFRNFSGRYELESGKILAFGNAMNEINLERTNEKRIKSLGVTIFLIMTPLLIDEFYQESPY